MTDTPTGSAPDDGSFAQDALIPSAQTVKPVGLIERLEAAEVGSRELDAHVEVAIRAVEASRTGLAREYWAKWSVSRDFWVEDPHTAYQPAAHTRSLDAALTLAERVLPGYAMNVCKDQGPPDGPAFKWSSVVARHSLSGPVGRPGWWFGVSDTPAVALCIAVLKALRATGEPR